MLYQKRYSSLIVRLDALAFVISETTTFLNSALIIVFASDFNSTLALKSAFCVFGIAEIFFFSVVFIEIVYAFNNFFIAGLIALKSFTN